MKDSSTATERVGRYQLLEPIGGGPNGTVARAKVFGVAGFERQFAVKRFVPELTVGAAAQALSQAARSYGSLEHPRIARMSEFGVAQGQTFTAVEYVAGLDVFRLLQETKLAGVAIAAGGALALVSQAARAVGYAHGRGLSHLGLSPTNVIVTSDGDVKVTDFGILAATMPQHPVESARLASRVPYLAPEQISGEATSAATDVFVLGVIAYELVTGQRAYRGESPAQIAQAILGGPPAEPPLPRPIVRVLQRCLARSPFERFPDARALADALDAALRVAPVPGTRKDVGAQVKTTLERYAMLNEGNVSGMVALNLSGPPVSDGLDAKTIHGIRPDARPEARTEPSPMPVMPSPSSSPSSVSPASTLREIPKPFTTMPGLAPPPIPVPPGVLPPPSPGSVVPASTNTLTGLAPVKKPVIPALSPPKRPGAPPSPPPSPDEEPEQHTVLGLSAPAAGPRPARPTPGQTFDSTTGEMSAHQIESLNRKATLATSEMMPVQRPDTDIGLDEQSVALHDANSVITVQADSGDLADTVAAFANDAQKVTEDLPDIRVEPPPERYAPSPVAASQPPMAMPAPMSAPAPVLAPPPAPAPVRPSAPPAPSSTRMPLIAGIVLAIGVLGAGGYVAYNELIAKKQDDAVTVADKGSAVAATGSAGPDSAGSGSDTGSAAAGSAAAGSNSDTGSAAAGSSSDTGSAAAGSGSDAGSAAGSGSDAGSGSAVQVAVAADAGAGSAATADTPPQTKPTGASDSLQVRSKPAGARVFIDGADQGVAPLEVPGSADRHTLAVFLPGHDLYLADVDGQGVYDVELKPVTPNGGHAGIKVIKCKDKERYYVYVDGNPTGMTCPTERIDTVIGPHVVEVYDIVTETRRKFDIVVKDERLSVRVRIDN